MAVRVARWARDGLAVCCIVRPTGARLHVEVARPAHRGLEGCDVGFGTLVREDDEPLVSRVEFEAKGLQWDDTE